MRNCLALVAILYFSLPSAWAITLFGGVNNVEGRIGIRYCAGNHRIVRVFPGSSAEAAGLQSGDKILLVDGEPPHDRWGYGPVDSEVKLRCERHGVILEFTIVRCINQPGW